MSMLSNLELIRRVPLFALLTANQAESVAEAVTKRRFKRGEVVVEQGEVTQTVSANGTLNPVVLISVGTQVSGTVRKLFVDFNDKVKKGQPLLELDDALVAASERQSAANVINAQAALDLAQANEARIKQLFAQEYVSKQ